jgi:Spy/CpxP family protein refolding chaperone
MAMTMKIVCFRNVLLVLLIVFCSSSKTAAAAVASAAATEGGGNALENEQDNHPSHQPQKSHKTYLRSLSLSSETSTSTASTTANSEPVVRGWGEEKQETEANHATASSNTRSSHGSITTAVSTAAAAADDEDNWDAEVRIIVQCKPGTEDNCLQQITSTGQMVNVVHQLPGTDFFALKVKKSVQQELSLLSDVDALERDPIRRPFATILTTTTTMKEQDRNRPRSLETGTTTAGVSQQITPYGVDLVQARQVWATYGITGQNVKVCVIDTGLKLHEDLNSNSNSNSDTTTTDATTNNTNTSSNITHSPPRTINGWANKLDLPWVRCNVYEANVTE